MTRTSTKPFAILFATACVLATACDLRALGSQGNEFVIAADADLFHIIYAAGVGNPDFGDDAPPGTPAAQKTQDTRDALAGWVQHEIARGALDAGYADAAMTMVGNDGVPIVDGPFGGWDEDAIATITGRLMELELDGVNNVLVVSHSNGVISTQQAFARFIADLPAEGSAAMCIHFHHTQAAGSQLSDFVPIEARYYDGSAGVHPTFRFTYNREDWMTYDPYRLSTVGRRESLPWVAEVTSLVPSITEQLANPNDETGGGGGAHDQIRTLEDLTTDAIVAGHRVEAGRLEIPSCSRR